MKVYKLVRMHKDGNCYPLFIDAKQPFTFNQKMHCKYVPTKGFAPRSVDDNQTGGWHCCFQPVAPHLSETLKTGEERVWIECEAEGKTKTYKRPFKQGGEWILVETITPLRIVPWPEVRKMQAEFNEKNNIPYIYRLDHVTEPETRLEITLMPDRTKMTVGFYRNGKRMLCSDIQVKVDTKHNFLPEDLILDIREAFKGYPVFTSADGMYCWTRE